MTTTSSPVGEGTSVQQALADPSGESRKAGWRKGRPYGYPNGRHELLDAYVKAFGIMLLVYAVGDRWIAWILRIPGTPFFAGEMLLGFGLIAYAFHTWPLRRAINLEIPVAVLAVLLTWAVIRLVPGVSNAGLVAVRDASVLYYLVFGAMTVAAGYHAAPQLGSFMTTYVKLTPWLVTFYPIGYALGSLLNLPAMPGSDTEFLSIRPANIAIHSGLCIATSLLAPDSLLNERRRVYVGVMGSLMIVLLATQNRSGFVAVCVLIATALVVRRARGIVFVDRAIKIGAVLVAGLLLMWISGISLQTERAGREVSVEQFIEVVENLTSGGTSGEEVYTTTIEFRNILWTGALNEMSKNDAWELGLGFGVPLGDALLPFHGNTLNELRNPHNSHLDILARTGLVGLGLWILMWTTWVATLIRRLTRDSLGPMNRMVVGVSLAGAPAMLFVSYFDPTLETVQAAIWCMALFGFGLVASAGLLPELEEPIDEAFDAPSVWYDPETGQMIDVVELERMEYPGQALL